MKKGILVQDFVGSMPYVDTPPEMNDASDVSSVKQSVPHKL